MNLELFNRRLDELQAVICICGNEALLKGDPEELFAFLLEEGANSSDLHKFSSQNIRLSLQLPPPPSSTANLLSSGLCPAATPAKTRDAPVLHLSLPPTYPEDACKCSLEANFLSRDAQMEGSTQLIGVAAAAAQELRECIFDLVQAAQGITDVAGGADTLPDLPKHAQHDAVQKSSPCRVGAGPGGGTPQAPAPSAAAPMQLSSTRGGVQRDGFVLHANSLPESAVELGGGPQAGGVRVCLLRLDHMRNRSGYCRTVRRWCAELGLSGRLLFQGPLILGVLEGGEGEVRECLTRWRTQNVDVDSRGRRCRERMMDVVWEGLRPSRAFQGFREEQLGCAQELKGVLEVGGLSGLLALLPVPGLGRP